MRERFERLIRFYRAHGGISIPKRMFLKLWRMIYHNRAMLFYMDLIEFENAKSELPDNITVEIKGGVKEISESDLNRLYNYKGEYVIKSQFKKRFPKGAQLWLLKVDNLIAGYRWTMKGGTVNPHFYPLIQKDVHLFDGEIFPDFRGRRLNPLFVDYMLNMLKNEGMERAFIEMREWNEANRRSIKKTSFHNIGVARKINIFGRNVVIWSKVVKVG